MAKRRNRQRNFDAMNSPRLKSYHNPENVDESRVPAGWRFRYADEMTTKVRIVKFGGMHGWYQSCEYGRNPCVTYIVPVA
jgi:hypothetical protein